MVNGTSSESLIKTYQRSRNVIAEYHGTVQKTPIQLIMRRIENTRKRETMVLVRWECN